MYVTLERQVLRLGGWQRHEVYGQVEHRPGEWVGGRRKREFGSAPADGNVVHVNGDLHETSKRTHGSALFAPGTPMVLLMDRDGGLYVDALDTEIEWPNGARKTRGHVAVNSFVVLHEVSDLVRVVLRTQVYPVPVWTPHISLHDWALVDENGTVRDGLWKTFRGAWDAARAFNRDVLRREWNGHPVKGSTSDSDIHASLSEVRGNGWVGFDLDGTLAHYTEFVSMEDIGPPIPAMIRVVRRLIVLGHDVRVVTGREASAAQESPEALERLRLTVASWTAENIGTALALSQKDHKMVALFDDRAVQVESNTGRLLEDLLDIRQRD
tara:strand:- start:8013 stop:8987 length:975 start_codon:yes stop_codon:yes gene_type:complete